MADADWYKCLLAGSWTDNPFAHSIQDSQLLLTMGQTAPFPNLFIYRKMNIRNDYVFNKNLKLTSSDFKCWQYLIPFPGTPQKRGGYSPLSQGQHLERNRRVRVLKFSAPTTNLQKKGVGAAGDNMCKNKWRTRFSEHLGSRTWGGVEHGGAPKGITWAHCLFPMPNVFLLL